MPLKMLIRLWLQGHALNEKLPSLILLEPLPSEAETQNITTALDQLVQHFGLGDYHQGLVKQVKDAFADSSQTLAAQLLPSYQRQVPF